MNVFQKMIHSKALRRALLLFGLAGPQTLFGQVNVSGKPGLLYTPSARTLSEGVLTAGYTYNPIRYAFRFNANVPNASDRSSESIYFINLALLPRLEVNLNLLIPNGNVQLGARGIGDRQIDVKYGIVTEKPRRPAVAVILSVPFGIDNSLETYAIAATKNVRLTESIGLEVTAGVGSPYYIYRDVRNDRNSGIFSGFTMRDKRTRNNYYLSGPYGGINLSIRKKAGLMVEWDSQHLNVGGYATVGHCWTIQGGLLNGDQFMLGTSYGFSLLKPSKRLALSHVAN